jgi:cytoskeletal protein RodZ
MDEREEILVIIFSIIGLVSVLLIISFSIWYIRRRRSKLPKRPIPRQQYQRSEKISSTNVILKKRRQRKKRFNTNESAISLSFNPPHLINQNVKNLDRLIVNETSLQPEDR